MKALMPLLAAGLTLALNTAHADDRTPTAQQSKMALCNKEAGERKGDERKKFMSECLSGKPAAADKPATQQERMKRCNAEAKGKTGDERKQFMSSCLKNK